MFAFATSIHNAQFTTLDHFREDVSYALPLESSA